jgi:four helix bundle protein
MGRLRAERLERSERFADRGLALAQTLQRKRVFDRVVGQVVGCFTSVGANVFEADEAMSTKDFCKSLAIAVKEANEARFWLRQAKANLWVSPSRLVPIESEAIELKRVLGAIVLNTKRNDAKAVQSRARG